MKSFFEFVGPRVSHSIRLGPYGPHLLFLGVLLHCGCSSETWINHEAFEEFIPAFEEKLSIDLASLGSCPEDWSENEVDAGDGYRIPYCEPPNLSELNPEFPLAPSPPNFLPCPSGWNEVEDGRTGLLTCQPYGPGGPEDCSGDDEAGNVDKIHFPGELECVRIGAECPEGPWATNLPSGRPIVYVEAGADFGEQTDGSQNAPFGSIGDAIAHAQSYAIIALSKGVFDEQVVLPSGIVLWGACVAETEVTSSIVSETVAVINTDSADTEVRNLRITGQRRGVFVFGNSANAHIEDVVIKSAHCFGIFVVSGAITVRNTVVRDTQSRQSSGILGIGLAILAGASAEVTRSVFTNNREKGIAAYETNTELKLHDVLVSDTQSQQREGIWGRGLNVEAGASAEVTRSVFANNRESGIYASGTNTKLSLHDVLVKDTRSIQRDGIGGLGLNINGGASTEVSRSVFTNNRYVGILAEGTNTELNLQEVLVSDTQCRQLDGSFGIGLAVKDGASVEVTRSVLTNNRDNGVFASGTNTELNLQEVLVSDTQSIQIDEKGGRGLQIEPGASVEVSRSAFTNNRTVGVFASGTNTELKLHDVLVRDTQSRQRDELFGRGLNIENGASVEVSRSVFTHNRDIGIFAAGTHTTLNLHEVFVSDTQSRLNDGNWGRGLNIQSGASIEVARSVFKNNRDVGFFAAGPHTKVNLYDVFVSDTQSRLRDGKFGRGVEIRFEAFAEVARSVFKNNKEVGIYVGGLNTKVTVTDSIVEQTIGMESDGTAGTGIGSYGGARIEMNRFVATRNVLCGVQAAFGKDSSGNRYEHGGELTLSNGIISHNEICGINVQTDTLNLENLIQSVAYFENNYNNLDSAFLHTPKASMESLPSDL